MIVIAGQIEVDASDHDRAAAAASAMIEASRQEPGCGAYTITQELGRPGCFRIFEEWESQAALDMHFAAPHLAEFERRITALEVRSLGAQRYEITSAKPLELPPHLQDLGSRK